MKKKLSKFAAMNAAPVKVDAENGILYGVRVCTVGEAKGHGVELEKSFIDEVIAQGNAKPKKGLKARFGHPNMCSEALGTYLGGFKNFRLSIVETPEGQKPCAMADLYLSAEAKITPQGDLWSYVCQSAINSPSEFGSSIVFEIGEFYCYDQLGNRLTHADEGYYGARDLTGKEYVTCGTLFGCDLVDTPAANDGLFSRFSGETLAGQVTEMLDDNPQVLEAIQKNPEVVKQFLGRYNEYLNAKGLPTIDLAKIWVETSVVIDTGDAADPKTADAPPDGDGTNQPPAEDSTGIVEDLRAQVSALQLAATESATAHATLLAAKDAEITSLTAQLAAKTDESVKVVEQFAASDKQFTAKIESLSAEIETEKKKTADLSHRLSVEQAGATPAPFGAPSGDAKNQKLTAEESAALHISKAFTKKARGNK